MSISFGGLATGLDTNALITELMNAERQPITRLEADKVWFQTRQQAYTAFDSQLKTFLSMTEKLGSSEELKQRSVTASSEDFFSVEAGVDALPGTSYQVEVLSLAQVQKSVSQGYADKAASNFGMGTLSLTVGDNAAVDIAIDDSNNSLEGIMAAINDADAGVTASIINDGTDAPYRLVLTGEDVATSFELTSSLPSFNGDVTALTTGGYSDADAALFGSGTISLSTGHDIVLADPNRSLNDIRDAINAETATTGVSAAVVDDGNNGFRLELTGGSISSTALAGGAGNDPFSFVVSQTATQAHIKVDTIDIYADGNVLEDAIPGVTLDLTKAEADALTTVSVKLDEDAIKSQINNFVKGYNGVMAFITAQSTIEGSSGGILGGDSGMNMVKRRLQNMLTKVMDNSGSFSALSQLGLETQKDGTIKVDDDKLTAAIQDDLDSVEKLLVGEDGQDGVAVMFQDYLEDITDTSDGLLASNKASTESNVKRIDSRIDQIELRLEHKEETLRAKFNSLELLVSGMNSQSSFLTAQLKGLENLWNYNK